MVGTTSYIRSSHQLEYPSITICPVTIKDGEFKPKENKTMENYATNPKLCNILSLFSYYEMEKHIIQKMPDFTCHLNTMHNRHENNVL